MTAHAGRDRRDRRAVGQRQIHARCPASPASTSPTAATSSSRASGSPAATRGRPRRAPRQVDRRALPVGEPPRAPHGRPERPGGAGVRRSRRSGPTPRTCWSPSGCDGRAAARPSTLSGGEAARAGLAVALANDPPVLLADEPTGEVDRENERLILDLLRARATAGGTVVVVTHSERVAAAADRVISLADGRIVDA